MDLATFAIITQMQHHTMEERMYGLVGHPLGHSFSKRFYEEYFASNQIKAQYLNFDISNIEDIANIISRTPNLQGFNVTIPYKESIIDYLDQLDDSAKEIGAVNVVKVVNRYNRKYLVGYNTDAEGFLQSICPSIDRTRINKALILGTGGAAKAIAFALKSMSINSIMASRSKAPIKAISYEDINSEVIKNHNIIINATPLGMWPNIDEMPPLPYHAIGSNHICFDAIYNPLETKFLSECNRHGAKIINGHSMLINQAYATLRVWGLLHT